MINTIGWTIGAALEVVCVLACIWLFGYIVKNGTGSLKDIIRTIGLTIRVICAWIRNKLVSSIEKEQKSKTEKKGKHEPQTFDEFCKEYGFPTKAEFEEKMRNHDPMPL